MLSYIRGISQRGFRKRNNASKGFFRSEEVWILWSILIIFCHPFHLGECQRERKFERGMGMGKKEKSFFKSAIKWALFPSEYGWCLRISNNSPSIHHSNSPRSMWNNTYARPIDRPGEQGQRRRASKEFFSYVIWDGKKWPKNEIIHSSTRRVRTECLFWHKSSGSWIRETARSAIHDEIIERRVSSFLSFFIPFFLPFFAYFLSSSSGHFFYCRPNNKESSTSRNFRGSTSSFAASFIFLSFFCIRRNINVLWVSNLPDTWGSRRIRRRPAKRPWSNWPPRPAWECRAWGVRRGWVDPETFAWRTRNAASWTGCTGKRASKRSLAVSSASWTANPRRWSCPPTVETAAENDEGDMIEKEMAIYVPSRVRAASRRPR